MTPQEAYDALTAFVKPGGGGTGWFWSLVEISMEGAPVDTKTNKPTGWDWHCALKWIISGDSIKHLCAPMRRSLSRFMNYEKSTLPRHRE